MGEGGFPQLFPNLATFQMPLNNPSKSLTPFPHRHLVNTPISGKGCSTGAQNSARVSLYAERRQAKSWTSEWLRSPSRTSVPSIGQNTESPAKWLLLWSPKCSLACLMNRETKAQDIFVHSHHLPIHLQSGPLSNSISSEETQALQILLLAPGWISHYGGIQ